MQPEVSVIIAAYNAAQFIERAVASALDQQGVDMEVVVVDDASTDDTLAVLRRLDSRRVKVIAREQNGGAAAARNTGFTVAQGAWIAVLDADDSMEPGRLVRLLDRARLADAQIVIDNLIVDTEDLSFEGNGKTKFPRDFLERHPTVDLACYLTSNTMFGPNPDLGYAKPVFEAGFVARHSIRYDERLRVGEDFHFVAECLARGALCVVDPTPGYRYYVRNSSVSSRLTDGDIAAMIAAIQRFGQTHRLRPSERRALAKRMRSMHNAAAFVRAVDQIKAGDILSGVRTALARPTSLPLFRMPIATRLKWREPTARQP